MADFRRLLTAVAVPALFVGMASAQVTNGGGTNGTPFTCTTTNSSVTPTVRSEGFTELMGDIVLSCTGGTALAPGSTIPTANITVFLNTQVTSRLLGNASGVNASEALLMIDEPNSGLQGYGPTVPFSVCSAPGQGAGPGGCTQVVGTISGNAGVPVSSTSATTPGANVFQGVVTGNQVTFFGVPILPPVTAGSQRVFRITNIRANATNINATGATPGPVQASISISGSNSVPLTNPTLVVAFVTPGLTTAVRNSGNTGNLGGSGTAFAQCTSTPSLGSFATILNYHSNFGTAFKTRVGVNATTGGQSSAATQNIPGTIYNSESGFILPIPGATTPAGLADFGTRFKAVFNNIPSGATLFVSTTNVINTTTGGQVNPGQFTSTTPFAQLIVSETAPENGNVAPTLTATTTNTAAGPNVGFVQFTPINGTVTAVWEVINSNTNQLQNVDFAVFLQYNSNVANNIPATGPVSVNMSYAPTPSQGAFTAAAAAVASSTLPIPRFADTSVGRTTATINTCTTSLLFPYVTTVTGFDTGIAISNTTQDPFGTTRQDGPCTLYWYGNTGGTANPANTTTATIVGGTTYAAVVSTTGLAGLNFTGYMIATCNFQLAHGYAAITDVGARGILSSYLALVINTRGQAGESLAH